MNRILAIDLGGTRYRAGIADVADPLDIRTIGEWLAPTTREDFLALVGGQLAEHGATRLGLGIPGLAKDTVCRWVPNLPYLDGLDLAEALPGISIGLGNDAQLSLLAEASAGAAVGLEDVILLAIGTGIGSAVLSGGRIVAGSNGGACSFGWASADMTDPGEDRSGWLERQASGRALDAAATSLGFLDGPHLVEQARTGHAAARETLAAPMRAIGTTLAGAVALLNPAAVIFAGGVTTSLDVLEPMILEPLQRHLPPHLRNIQLKPGHFGPRAGLIGASFAGTHGKNWRENNG